MAAQRLRSAARPMIASTVCVQRGERGALQLQSCIGTPAGLPTGWHFMKAKEKRRYFHRGGSPHDTMTASNSARGRLDSRSVRAPHTAFLLAVAYEDAALGLQEGGNVVRLAQLPRQVHRGIRRRIHAGQCGASAENFLGYVKGTTDGVPQARRQWAHETVCVPRPWRQSPGSPHCSAPERKTRSYTTFNAFACMRRTATENLEQLMIAVGNSMGGHYGKPGQRRGGYYFDGGSDAPCNLILTGNSSGSRRGQGKVLGNRPQ